MGLDADNTFAGMPAEKLKGRMNYES